MAAPVLHFGLDSGCARDGFGVVPCAGVVDEGLRGLNRCACAGRRLGVGIQLLGFHDIDKYHEYILPTQGRKRRSGSELSLIMTRTCRLELWCGLKLDAVSSRGARQEGMQHG